ncbi:hypothetical protein SLA_0458 [Streptomyces laurentii]|uniref:Uncharacterized protein n=1 Tax=Streptomyces laurentii TaxID=39478 RepID=A0A160NUY4_STRLU|nr:hypothetical protein SLA_0458 [Streptomyces laurentii]
MMLSPGVVVAELGSSAVLLNTGSPAAAYVSPTALGWLQGQPPAPEHHDQHAHCLTQWRSAGLVSSGHASTAPTGPSGSGALEAQAAGLTTLPGHPVLVVAMSDACGFCGQLTADLAANASCLARLNASVLLVDPTGTRLLGRSLYTPAYPGLTRLGQDAARQGTPTAVLLSPGRPPEVRTGFAEVSHALIALSGADPHATVVEAPTSCSVNVAAAPVDAVLTARVGGTRLGIAVRGPEARRIAEEATGAVPEDGYTPVTLTLERPETLHLLFRGGELLARARTPEALRQVLDSVLAGYARYATAERGEIPLLCGAAVREGGDAVLFPRGWMSDLVKHARQLDRAGWRLRPEPYTLLRTAPDTATLHLPGPDGTGRPGPAVTAVLTQAPETGPAPTRPRLLASIVNWIARPATTDAVHTLAAALRPVPVLAGTWQEAVTHLKRSDQADA